MHVIKLAIMKVWEILDLFNYIFDLILVKYTLIIINSFLAYKNLRIFMELYFGHMIMSVKFRIHKDYRTFCNN